MDCSNFMLCNKSAQQYDADLDAIAIHHFARHSIDVYIYYRDTAAQQCLLRSSCS